MSNSVADTIPHYKISGKLVSGVSHHFSYVIYQQPAVGEDEKYYELKPSYHKDHKPGGLFTQWWAVARRRYGVEQLLAKRAKSVLGRASVNPIEVLYMTTYHWLVDGKVTRQRHLIGVRLTDQDFQFLETGGYLRETQIKRNRHDLIPFTVVRERVRKYR